MDPIGYIIGLIGVGYAVYQGGQRKKLQKLARTQAWVLYNKTNNLTGIIQAARNKYIEKHKENIDSWYRNWDGSIIVN